jgi:hypothetical protein
LLVAVAVAALAVVVPWLSRDPWQETGRLYAGLWSDGRQVFLLVREGGDPEHSELLFSGGLACWLIRRNRDVNAFQISPWINHAAARPGLEARLHVEHGANGLTLELDGAGATNPVSLKPVGWETTHIAKSGWRLGPRGLSTASKTSTLVLEEDHPAAALSNPLRRTPMDEPFAESRVGLRELLDGVRYPSHGNAHQYARRLMPLHLGRESASFLEVHYEYTGGAHGNSTLTGVNLARTANGWESVELDALFLRGSNWRERINARVWDGLKALEASSVVNQPPETKPQEVWGEFAVTACGLVFLFSPYEVASYAEGCFAVFVPFSDVAGCLDTNGPLQRFLDK